jgi:DNA-binding SARP family transcriptional activator
LGLCRDACSLCFLRCRLARARRIPELRTLVCLLRTFPALSQRLDTVPGGYRLEVRPGELDLERFRLLADQGGDALAGGRYQDAARLLRRSLELWEDPPLADLSQTEVMQRLAAKLLEERHAARLDMAEALLALGQHRALVPHLLAQVGEHPADERAWEFLMIALYRAARRADALGAFRVIDRTLRDEYGIAPGPRLRRLHQDILRDDPALGPPTRQPS